MKSFYFLAVFVVVVQSTVAQESVEQESVEQPSIPEVTIPDQLKVEKKTKSNLIRAILEKYLKICRTR